MADSSSREAPSSPSVDSAQEASPAHEALQEFFDAQAAKRGQTPVLSICLLFVVVTFLYTSYHTVRENFALERVQAEAQKTAEVLIEDATPLFVSVLRNTAPVYQREAERALRETAPKLADRAQSELRTGLDAMTIKAHVVLQEVAADYMASTLQHTGGQLPEGFEYLLTDEAQEECEALVMTEMAELFRELDDQYQPPTRRLIDAMEELAPEGTELDYEELRRRFVHLWLVLIDTEVTEGTSLEPLPLGLPTGTE